MKKIIICLSILISTITFSQQSYYNDVDLNLTGTALKDALATKIINTHTYFLTYTPDVWTACKVTDVNPDNSAEVLLVYGYTASGTTARTSGINNNGGNNGNWNREHVYPKSLGTPNLGESGPGSDAHHLRPADKDWNSTRGNKKFVDGSGTASGSMNGGWFPGDEWKGDVARMMMYMYLRYGNRCLPSNVGVGSNSATPDDMIDLFLKWNAEDPVTDFERGRNTYHENTSNTAAQGNRNPFIDNPRLATRIWGGPEAEDTWGIYTSTDNEAPTTPTNVTASNVTTFSFNVSWTASTDNVGVSSYDVFLNGNLYSNTTNTNVLINGLNSNTTYTVSVLAKDIANNQSSQSTPVNVTTLQDTEAPTVPTNIVISNETGTTFIATWSASTDNTAVTSYDIYLDGAFNANTTQTTYTVTGLSNSTTYAVQILAKDAIGNMSALSTAVNATTTDGSTTTANELFFSEYVEGSSNNKALEIANVTNNNIDLSAYSIKRQKNGGQDGDDWANELVLSGTLLKNDVFVVINGDAALQELIDEADLVVPNESATNFGAPINFNGNDPVGLFKNNVLIDIIGTYNGGSANFAKDKTLRRKSDITGPNTAFDITNEWEVYPQNTVDNIGQHNTVLNLDNFFLSNFSIYPNPTNGNRFFVKSEEKSIIKIYNVIGKLIQTNTINGSNKEIDISQLKQGIYILKISFEGKTYSKKLIKN